MKHDSRNEGALEYQYGIVSFMYTLQVYVCYKPLAKPYHICVWRV